MNLPEVMERLQSSYAVLLVAALTSRRPVAQGCAREGCGRRDILSTGAAHCCPTADRCSAQCRRRTSSDGVTLAGIAIPTQNETKAFQAHRHHRHGKSTAIRGFLGCAIGAAIAPSSPIQTRVLEHSTSLSRRLVSSLRAAIRHNGIGSPN